MIIVLITVLVASPGFAQIKVARREMSLYNYSRAIEYLNKILKSKNQETRKEAALLLAECYRKQNDVPNAAIWYGKALESGDTNAITKYYYACALRSSGNYPEAKKMFLDFFAAAPPDPKGKIYAEYCDSAISWMIKPPHFKVSNVKVLNSPQSEFGAVYFRDGIVFASDRILNSLEGRTYGWTGSNYLRLYFSGSAGNDSVQYNFFSPEALRISVDPAWHEGPAAFDHDFTEIYINRTLKDKDQGKKDPGMIRTHLLKIFTAGRSNEKWSKPEPFFLNSTEYSVGHPALSHGGDTLFFVSDMPGGFGGTDIWYCTRIDDRWSELKSAGPSINTFGNEMFPYAASNGDLYFASDGLPGYGGLDLFVSYQVNGTWSTPENLGRDINSSCDDFSLATNDNGTTGFFSSNRPGGKGSDDLYYFSPLSPPPPPPPPAPLFISGCVKDRSTLEAIPQATVFLLDGSSDTVLILKSDDKGCFRTTIMRNRKYSCKAMKSSYIPDCLSFGIDASVSQNELSLPRVLLLDRLELNKKYTLENIFYDFDKWDIRHDAKPSLDKLVRIMKENPVNVELGSHTDCRGSDDYNMVLSQKRAESAVAYIVLQGIDPSRITAKGYGESQLVNRCNCSKSVTCSEEEHQANRRTEFRITGWTSSTGWTGDPGMEIGKLRFGQKLKARELPDGFFKECEMK